LRLRTAAALAALACLSGCAGGGASPEPAPDRGGRQVLSTEHHDQRVGADVALDVASELGVLETPALTVYVQEVGHRLARGATARAFDYHFGVLDQFEPNALALPGGYIYVSRGLLALANSEDELANVLGHEIVHAAARHAAAQQEVLRRQRLLTMPIQRRASLAAYGRDQEREADHGGQGLAAAAGYDPMGLATFLERLGRVETLRTGASRLPGFFETHPGTGERVATAVARARQLRPPEGAAEPEATGRAERHLARIEGLVLGTSPSEGVILGSRFLHPDLGFQLAFPEGWSIANTRRAVGATSPKGDAVIFLTSEGPARDPKQAAEELAARLAREYRAEVARAAPLKIGALDAYRIGGYGSWEGRAVAAQLTLIPYRGVLYRLTGVAPRAVAEDYLGRARNTARSFRPLGPEEGHSFEALHLRVVEALPGEGLAALARRAGNAWDLQRSAVLNGVFSDVRFRGGERVKIARAEPYRPAGG